MKLVRLDEFGLIDRETKNLHLSNKQVVVGVGDDAAVIKWQPHKYLLVTIDTFVEKIHFQQRYFSFYQLGWKALASNISDLAAMGGVPRWMLISLGLTGKEAIKNVDEIYRGLYALSKKFKINLIGGDTVSSPKGIVVTIVLLGEVEKKNLVLRKGAKPGDKIFVTGTLGDSSAGLEILKKNPKSEIRNPKSEIKKLIRKHLLPEPRVKEARFLAKRQLVTAMIDVSDGLDLSIKFICQASGVGARIYLAKIPLSSAVQSLTPYALRLTPIEYALYGGEDYELLFTSPANKSAKVEKLKDATLIGETTKQKGEIEYINSQGEIIQLKGKGYQHF